MPRCPKVPAYRLHKQSGKAVITWPYGHGVRRDVLLGNQSKESQAEYVRVIAEWQAGVRTAAARGGATVGETGEHHQRRGTADHRPRREGFAQIYRMVTNARQPACGRIGRRPAICQTDWAQSPFSAGADGKASKTRCPHGGRLPVKLVLGEDKDERYLTAALCYECTGLPTWHWSSLHKEACYATRFDGKPIKRRKVPAESSLGNKRLVYAYLERHVRQEANRQNIAFRDDVLREIAGHARGNGALTKDKAIAAAAPPADTPSARWDFAHPDHVKFKGTKIDHREGLPRRLLKALTETGTNGCHHLSLMDAGWGHEAPNQRQESRYNLRPHLSMIRNALRKAFRRPRGWDPIPVCGDARDRKMTPLPVFSRLKRVKKI
jgi:hypothetical protein